MLEQADAYATFADGGVHHDPTAIAKVVFPDGDDGRARAARGQPRDLRRGRLRGRPTCMKGDDRLRDRGPATDIRCPAAGKTGTTEEPVRRLVRRLHAARLDRGLGRQPGFARADARLRRRPRGADLARLHGGRARRATATTSRSRRTRPTSRSYSSCAHRRLVERLDDHRPTAHDTTTPATTTPDAPGPATGTAATTNGYDPDLYAPGAGQGAPRRRTAGGAGGVDPNRAPAAAPPARFNVRVIGEFELIAAIRERLAAAGAPQALGGAGPRQRRRRRDNGAGGRAAATTVDALVEGVHFRLPPFHRSESAARHWRGRSPTSRRWAPTRRGLRHARGSRRRGEDECLEIADGMAEVAAAVGRARRRRRDTRRRRCSWR